MLKFKMMIVGLTITILGLIVCHGLSAPIMKESFKKNMTFQDKPFIQWNQTYGGIRQEEGNSLIQMADGGFVLGGETWSYGTGAYDMWLVKIDAAGVAQWNRTYGGTSVDRVNSLVQTVDGGFALAGSTTSYGAGKSDMWLVKTDANGIAQWNRTYGGTSSEWLEALIQTTDGGFALAGHTYSYGAGESDL